MSPRRDGEAGLTLVEVLVALVLFALIAGAGFSVLDQVVRVQRQTEGRLERLAAMQRTMQVVTQDLMQAEARSLTFADGAVTFRRSAGEGGMAVRYDLQAATLVRTVSGRNGAGTARQRLLPGVTGLRWSFLDRDRTWLAGWPKQSGTAAAANPVAVALDLAIAGPELAGDLRRVAILPADSGPAADAGTPAESGPAAEARR